MAEGGEGRSGGKGKSNKSSQGCRQKLISNISQIIFVLLPGFYIIYLLTCFSK